jgi:DNA helicase-2/ATP-dependent DNA helicase PcrA
MSNTINDIATFDGKIAKIDGAPASGKTAGLIARCVKLLESGIDGRDITVIVSSTAAANAFKSRVTKALKANGVELEAADTLASSLNVCTAADACRAVLDTEAAREATKRVPNALTSFEYTFLLEDMLTLGQPMRRLRAMMAHFKEALAQDEAADVVARAGEESIVFEHMVSVLKFQESMLAEELAWHANVYLTSDAGRDSAHSCEYVLADDFQNLSLAEQHFCCHIAKTQLIVAGCTAEAVRVSSSYPSAEGFANFDKLRKNVELFTLDSAPANDVAAFASAIAANDALSCSASYEANLKNAETSEETQLRFVSWNTPEDEIGDMSKIVRVISNEDNETPYSQSVIVVPNKRWAKAFKQMLTKRGFRVLTCGFNRIGGDPRIAERSRAIEAYTKLRLLADPTDCRAWRIFAGLGNYLCRSDAWTGFMEFAASNNLSMSDAVRKVVETNTNNEAEELFLLENALSKRFAEGLEFIEQNTGACGYNLLSICGAEGLDEFADIEAMLDGDENAACIAAIAERMQKDVIFANDSRAIRIASFESLAGLSFKHVYCTGCIDGYMPNRNAFEVVSTDDARDKILGTERRAFINGVSKCRGELILSTFATADLELAERTHAQVVRIRAVDKARMAHLRHTCFIDEAGHYAPSIEGGQAMLSAYGAD